VPNPYKPPVPKHTQAVQKPRGFRRNRLPQRWRRLWFVPLLGLLPVLVAVVLASEGYFAAPAAPSLPLAAPLATTGSNQVPAGQAQPAQPGAQSPAAAVQTPTTAAQTGGSPGTATTAAGNASAAPSVASGATTTTTATRPTNSGAALFRAYRVQAGDTVKFVAQMFGVSPASVAQASGLQNPDQLRIGQLLTVPIQPGWLYRVQSGETLDQIAARTGISSAVILSASRLTVDSVQPGDVILIPDQTAALGK
jgi:LysM repeat protein